MTTSDRIDEAFLRRLIAERVEESLVIEYKAAAYLGRNDSSKTELTKDVSAMANSAGGRIYVGIKEGNGQSRHLPVQLDPCRRSDFSREWLDQVLGNIQPRIDGLVITPVPVGQDPNDVVYVIDVPQSTTAHQAADMRYYRRSNFQCVPLHDYEIRDVMNRSRHPLVGAELSITRRRVETQPVFPGMGEVKRGIETRLRLRTYHDGGPLARFINGFLAIPAAILDIDEFILGRRDTRHDKEYAVYAFDNTERDVLGYQGQPPFHTATKGPSWFSPLLPGTSRQLYSISILGDELANAGELAVEWSLHADSAPPKVGSISLAAIPVDADLDAV